MIGQTLTSIAGPLITNMSAKVSANWFPKEERVVATNVGLTFSQIGNAAGFLLPIVFVNQKLNGMG